MHPHAQNQAPVATTSAAIQQADFDLVAEMALLKGNRKDIGAIASFIGCVRNNNSLPNGDRSSGKSDSSSEQTQTIKTISQLELEHYPGMTEKSLYALMDEACGRFAVYALRVVHRVGILQPGEQIVLVLVAAEHRSEAFAACAFVMDQLKISVPFWKKESTPVSKQMSAQMAGDQPHTQNSHWVQERASDHQAANRWGQQLR